MQYKELRKKSKWYAIISVAIADLIGFYYDWAYPDAHILGPKWLILIHLISFLIALIVTIVATPTWQSLIAWAMLVLPFFIPHEDPWHHIGHKQTINPFTTNVVLAGKRPASSLDANSERRQL